MGGLEETRRMLARGLLVGALTAFAAAGACGSEDSTGQTGGAEDAGTDGTALDGAQSGDGAHANDGGVIGIGDYHDITDGSLWTSFDLSTFEPAFAHGTGFFGGAFDGRYVYLVPYQRGVTGDAGASVTSGLVVRYDTQAAFGAAAAWSEFDVATVNPMAVAFTSSTFDGRYLYFTPGPVSSFVARYDTQAAFGAASSWTTFQLDAGGYIGSAFDGRYLYAARAYGAPRAQRHDTQAALDAGTSWTSFDPTSLAPQPKGMLGTIFDGRYVYFGSATPGAVANAVTVRYDTQGAFDVAGSWKSFDVATANPKASAFAGGVFDGRYVYFSPYYVGGMPTDVAARYDTQTAFDDAASWTTFDTTPLAKFQTVGWGALFDGRFVYMIPWLGSTMKRYDTAHPFDQAASWSTFDTTHVNANAQRFRGGVFDGRYIYFVPSETGVVARFDARSTPAIPSSYHGSFF